MERDGSRVEGVPHNDPIYHSKATITAAAEVLIIANLHFVIITFWLKTVINISVIRVAKNKEEQEATSAVITAVSRMFCL